MGTPRAPMNGDRLGLVRCDEQPGQKIYGRSFDAAWAS
jgi:hypothetical protein